MKNEISAIMMDFVKIEMNKDKKYVHGMSLMKRINKMKDLKQSILQKIRRVFFIEEYDIPSLNFYDYDFFVDLFELINSTVKREVFCSNDQTVPNIYTHRNGNKGIDIFYSEFCKYRVEFSINKFIKITSNIFGNEESFQFFNKPEELPLDARLLLINFIRGLYDFFVQYVDKVCLSTIDIIKLYMNDRYRYQEESRIEFLSKQLDRNNMKNT